MNDIAFLELTNGGYTVVDADRFQELNKERWHRFKDGSIRQTTNCYLPNSGNKRRTVLLHRVVNGTPEGKDTDHINGDRNDNRARNLRTVNNAENHWNSKKSVKKVGKFTSQYKGVHYLIREGRNPKWVAFIGSVATAGKKFLGQYETEVEAARAYDKEARRRFGQYARLNFPD